MAAGVNVRFSASIKELIDATNQVKSAIDDISAKAAKANEMLSKFGEISGIGISIEGIKRLVESMAELGKHTEDMSHILGVSTTSVQEFGYLAKLTGTDADSLATAMARFQLAITKAQNPTSQQAAALRAFGLSAKDLIGLPLDQQMAKFSDAVSKFADGTGKTAAIEALNRTLVPLIPLLDEGSAGFAKITQHAEETGAIMTGQTIEALANLDTSLVEAKASLLGIAGTLVGVFAPDLTEATNRLNEFVSTLAIMIETGNVWEYVSVDIGTRLEVLGLKTARLVKAMEDLRNMHPLEAWQDLSIGQAAIDDLQKKINGDLGPVIAKAREELKALLAPPAGSPGAGGGKPQVPSIDVNRGSENSAKLSGMNAEIELENKAYQQTVAHLNAEQKIGELTERQKTAAVLAAINQREDAQLALLTTEETDGNLSVQQRQEVEDKKTAIIQQAVAQRQKAVDQQNQAEAQSAKNAADMVAGAFNSQLRSLLAGTETFSQAMKSMFADIVIKLIEDADTFALEWLAKLALVEIQKLLVEGPAGAIPGLPGFETGAWEIPSIMPAILHPGEMVVPAGPAAALRAGIDGNASGRMPALPNFAQNSSSDNRSLTANLNIHGADWSASTIRANVRTIAQELNSHWQSNPSTRPKGW